MAGLAAGAVTLLLALELVLRMLPVSTATLTGYHFDADLLTYPAHHRWTVSTGWDLRNPQHLHSNNRGFVSERDFVRDAGAVALIGDSFVEASMLDTEQRPEAQLQAEIGAARVVFAMGSPGTALLDYAQRIRWAHEQFGIRDFVLLIEPGDARQSLCGSGNVHSRCLRADTLAPEVQRQAPPGLAKRVGRQLALAQYFVGQLKLRPDALLGAMFRRSTPHDGQPADESSTTADRAPARAARQREVMLAVVDAFFRVARPHVRGRLIILVDAVRPRDKLPTAEDHQARHELMAALREGGAEVVDLAETYARHFAGSTRSLAVGPYDGHLNGLGVHLAMRQAAAALAR